VQTTRTPDPDEQPEADPALDALAFIVETYLATKDPAEAAGFLKVAAARLEAEDGSVVNLRDGLAGTTAKRLARGWLRRRIPMWLAKLP
jgi:hypothetical protein